MYILLLPRVGLYGIYAFLKHTHKTSHTDKNKTESLVCRYMKNGKSHVKKFQTANFIINK